jgi:hypothetical protein
VKVEASVDGGPETSAALIAFATAMENDAVAAAQAAAIVAGVAGGSAPVRTGALAASYGVQDTYVVNPLQYAGPIEYGVPDLGMAPQFVVTNAWESSAGQVEAVYSTWAAEQARAVGLEATSE